MSYLIALGIGLRENEKMTYDGIWRILVMLDGGSVFGFSTDVGFGVWTAEFGLLDILLIP